MAANTTITANFTLLTFSITASAGSNGSISPLGITTVNYGSGQSYTITPSLGYHIVDVVVDGGSVGAVTNYAFSNVTGSHTISASFAINTYPITASSSAHGSISPPGITTLNYGQNQIYTMTPSLGYHVADLLVDGASVGALSSYTFNNINTPHTISVSFSINTYTVTASAGSDGTILPSGVTTLNYGDNQTYNITPDAGHHIVDVLVDGISVGVVSTYTFSNVTANHTITASFAIDTFTITASAGANGSVTPSGATSVNYHASEAYTITPLPGYHVVDVLIDGISVGAVTNYTFTSVTGTHTISATFAINSYTISASAGAGGGIAPAGTTTLSYGGSQGYTITANPGYHISDVVVDGSSVGAITSYTFSSVSGNHSIIASFTINGYTITATSSSNGSISPSGPVATTFGSTQVFSISPNVGAHIIDVLVDGISVGPVTSYAFNAISANHTIHADFGITSFTITSSAGSHGGISPAGVTTLNYGVNQTYIITPSVGYHVADVLVDGSSVGAVTNFSFNNITATHTISATFAINRYTVTASAGSNGSVSPSGITTLDHGATQVYTIAPASGYHIIDVLIDGISVGPAPVYAFTNITGSHTIAASFAINLYTLTASSGSNGNVNPIGVTSVSYGSTFAYTITPDAGYHVSDVLVDGVSVGAVTSYSFIAVAASHTISASFAINTYLITATSGPNGTITPSGATSVSHGGSQSFSVTPSPGYHVVDVLVDGGSVGAVTSYLFTNVTQTHTISVTFAITLYTITATSAGNGVIIPSGVISLTHGSSQLFTLTPQVGYHIDSLLVDGVIQAPALSYLFASVVATHSIHVVFAIDEYVIISSSGPNGTISPSGSVTRSYGSSQVYTMLPSMHYEVDSVIVDGSYIGTPATYTFTNIVAGHTIAVRFKLISSYLTSYRSFTYNELPIAKPVKKKTETFYWEFIVRNTTSIPVSQINVVFKTGIRELESSTSFESFNVPSFGTCYKFYGLFHPGDSIMITGRSLRSSPQLIKYLWFGNSTKIPADRISNIMPSFQRAELPMPNLANVRDEAYQWGGFRSTNGLVVGRMVPEDPRHHGWVRMDHSKDMLSSLFDRHGLHVNTPRGFDKFDNNRPFVKEQKSLPPSKQNNILFGDMLALRFNITLSSMGMTQLGFGELRFVRNGSPWNGMLVRDIARECDSLLTHVVVNPTLYSSLDSVIGMINQSFSGDFDTLSWGDTLKIRGVRELLNVAYLQPSGVPPEQIVPKYMADQQLPTRFELLQNYPNPFNPTTTIQFNLAAPSIVTLKVYNLLGQVVATLHDREQMDEGVQEIEFGSSSLASGVYFYRIVAEEILNQEEEILQAGTRTFTSVKKMMLIK